MNEVVLILKTVLLNFAASLTLVDLEHTAPVDEEQDVVASTATQLGVTRSKPLKEACMSCGDGVTQKVTKLVTLRPLKDRGCSELLMRKVDRSSDPLTFTQSPFMIRHLSFFFPRHPRCL